MEYKYMFMNGLKQQWTRGRPIPLGCPTISDVYVPCWLSKKVEDFLSDNIIDYSKYKLSSKRNI